MEKVNLGVVIPAAGIGKRMNSTTPKQFLTLDGEPILVHTVAIFEQHPAISEIILVTNAEYMHLVQDLVNQKKFKKVQKIIIGGRERQNSVYQGVLSSSMDFVLVHDAVRPFVSKKSLDDLVVALEAGKQAATLAVPVKETIKRVDESGKVKETLNRVDLWSTQTPQAFSRELLLTAHQFALSKGIEATDDAMLVEALGESVFVVEGDYTNIKITTPEDILIGETIYGKKADKISCL